MKLDFFIGVAVGAVVVYGYMNGWLDSIIGTITMPALRARAYYR